MYVKLKEKDLHEIERHATYTCCFCFMNIGLKLFSDREDSIKAFTEVYENFITDDIPDEYVTFYLLKKSGLCEGPCAVINGMLYKLPESQSDKVMDWPEMMIFQRIIEKIENHLLLHAGVVSKNGKAYIIYAPSGFGKTTLVLELVSRGYKFLSDEYCPVDLSDFSISPFPRRLGLKPDSPFSSMINMDRAFFLEYEDKLFVDCNDIFPGRLGTTCRAKYLIVLGEELHSKIVSQNERNVVDLVLFHENQKLMNEISQYTEVEVVHKFFKAIYVGYRLSMSKNRSLIKAFHDIWKKYEQDIFCVGALVNGKPDFTDTPEIASMPRSEVIFEVLANLINRVPTGKLMEKFGGKTSAILLEIGNFIKDVECYRIKHGILNEMADIIDNL